MSRRTNPLSLSEEQDVVVSYRVGINVMSSVFLDILPGEDEFLLPYNIM